MENLEQKRRVTKRLREWRENEASRMGVELFRVLSNDAMNGIVETLPTTKEELLKIKGIAEKKCQLYGRDILAMVAEETTDGRTITNGRTITHNDDDNGRRTTNGRTMTDDDDNNDGGRTVADDSNASEKILSVFDYLEMLNIGLKEFEAKVVGEITSLDIRPNYLFFSIKDKKENALMSCFMWGSAYKMSGVELVEGMEVCVGGFPEMYKPSGRLTFRANTVELVGEGALKKAYDALKKKLETEGLFDPSRKKIIPEYPQKIGLITSATGAVIHDFLNNIGKFGFKISFRDSRVEGALAVKELVTSVRYFKKRKDIDVLVLIRGGGSLESLQAFNNEVLVRELADCPFPVLVGIGHDKDVPLVSLVADKAGSTPTAVARLLNTTWEQALSKVRLSEQRIFSQYSDSLYQKKDSLREYSDNIEEKFRQIFERFRDAEEILKRNFVAIGASISRSKENVNRFEKLLFGKLEMQLRGAKERLKNSSKTFPMKFSESLERLKDRLSYSEKMISANNPMRQLKLGYSLAFANGKVIRKIEEVKPGDEIKIRVEDGTIITKVQ